MSPFEMFGAAIAVGSVLSVALSLFGAHLATRDSALQSMAISQGAQLGVLLSLGFMHAEGTVLPWLGGFAVALVVFLLSGKVSSLVRASKNTIFIVFFLALLAGSYCLISILPMLDSHHSQAFFGDLVYLSGVDLYAAGVVGVASLLLFLLKCNTWSNHSFMLATFAGDSLVSSKKDILFLLSSLVLIVTSVFSVGLMFTLSALFIPTMVLSFVKKSDLKLHFLLCALVSFFGVILGFFITLEVGDYPTVPVVVLVFLLLSLFVLVFFNLLGGRRLFAFLLRR